MSIVTTWTCHYEASGLMSWTLEDTKWSIHRETRSDGRYVYRCKYGDAFHATKSDLVLAQRHCERDGEPFLMPWGWTTTPEAAS